MAGWCIREGARPPSAGGRIARGLPRAHPAPAALASPLWRGHRFARRARRNDGGETRRLRAARIPIRTRAVAATGNGPLAPELAACVRLYVRWATCRGGMAGGASWVSSGRAGTMVGNAGASARRASPSAHGRSRQRTAGAGTGRRASRRAKRQPCCCAACRPRSEAAALAMGRVGWRDGRRCIVAGTAASAGSALRSLRRVHPSTLRSGVAIASRAGRAGTMVGKCGRLPRRAHPHPHAAGRADGRRAAGAGTGRRHQAALTTNQQREG